MVLFNFFPESINSRLVMLAVGGLLCVLVLPNVYAQRPVQQDTTVSRQAAPRPNQFEEAVRSSADLEVDGLVVDETITKIGRDFYDVFHRQWEAPPSAKNYTILIKERPTRGNGALIQVTLNDELLFEQQLMPRYDTIEETATYVAEGLFDYLVRNQLQQQLEAEGRQQLEVF